MTVAALILAAGESTRMGRPKPLLPWAGTTLLAWQVEQMREAGAREVIVVLGHQAKTAMAAVPATARAVTNERYAEGRASSLRCGSAALGSETECVLILGVDQPRPAWLARRLIEAWRGSHAAVVVPAHVGRRGHPVLVDRALIGELRDAREETLGLRAVLQRHEGETIVLETPNDVINVDLNTPAEYEKALAELAAGGWEEDR